MNKIIQQNRQFFIGFCLWLIVGAILQIFFTQNELILWVNRHNNPFFDFFFQYITDVGDGIFYAVCIVFLFILRKKQAALIGLVAFALVTGVLAHFLKEYIRTPRPITVFANHLQGIHLVEGVKIVEWLSFPSGHTISAFSIFLIFSFITRNKNWGILYVLIAMLVAYSRMYLFQHFAIDVYAGSVFGVSFTLLIIYIFEKNVKL